MSYRDDQDALVARNVALERQVKDLEKRAPAPPPTDRANAVARGLASVTGILSGTAIAIVSSLNYFSADYMWMGCAVAGVSVVAPFLRRAAPRPFTVRSTTTVACADVAASVTLIAVVHFSPDPADRARRAQVLGTRAADARRIAQDMIEGVLREQLGAVPAVSVRTDGAALSVRIQEQAAAALAGYGLRVDRLFVSATGA